MTNDELEAMRATLENLDERCAQGVALLTAAAHYLDVSRAHINGALKCYEAGDRSEGSLQILRIVEAAAAGRDACQRASTGQLGLLSGLLVDAPLDEDTLVAAMGSEADLLAARESIQAAWIVETDDDEAEGSR